MSHSLTRVLSRECIQNRVAEMGKDVSRRYADLSQPLVAVCVLKGAFIFFADLVRRLDCPVVLDFVRLASYGQSTSRTERVLFTKDMEIDVRDRHVLLVEDIVDTGHSIAILKQVLLTRSPASVAICALVDKVERREVDVVVDFPGFRLEKGFIVGYGLDYAEQFRNLDAIYDLTL